MCGGWGSGTKGVGGVNRQSTSNTFPSKSCKRESKALGGTWAPKLPLPFPRLEGLCVHGGPLGKGVSAVAAFAVSSKGLTFLKSIFSLPVEYMCAHRRARTMVCVCAHTCTYRYTIPVKTDNTMGPLWGGGKFWVQTQRTHTSKFLYLYTHSEI